jgi:hypothetical protein
MIKINWSDLFAAKAPNPDRDWQWLLSAWLVAVAVIFLAGAIAYLSLFNRQAAGTVNVTASSTVPAVDREELEAVVKIINDRAGASESLKNTPLNLVDPSL